MICLGYDFEVKIETRISAQRMSQLAGSVNHSALLASLLITHLLLLRQRLICRPQALFVLTNTYIDFRARMESTQA